MSSTKSPNDFTPYVFESKEVYGQGLIHLINLLFKDNVIGAEVGIGSATNFCTLLQQCPNIKTLYGVDQFKPYSNFLKERYDGIGIPFDEKQLDFVRLTAFHNIKYSGFAEKAIIIEEDSITASKQIEDNSLDFIFLDAHSTPQQAKNDLVAWHAKVKDGGIISGHDWFSSDVRKVVSDFRFKNQVSNTLSTFDNVWAWIK